MANPNSDRIPSAGPAISAAPMLPKSLVAVVIGLAFLPHHPQRTGVQLLGRADAAVRQETRSRPTRSTQVAAVAQQLSTGAIIYVLLEWTAFMIALATVVLAVTHYFITHDVTTPTISTALFFSGMIDAFEALAGVHLLPVPSRTSTGFFRSPGLYRGWSMSAS